MESSQISRVREKVSYLVEIAFENEMRFYQKIEREIKVKSKKF